MQLILVPSRSLTNPTGRAATRRLFRWSRASPCSCETPVDWLLARRRPWLPWKGVNDVHVLDRDEYANAAVGQLARWSSGSDGVGASATSRGGDERGACRQSSVP